ncbi:MAG TPA: hypothetical protein VF773_11940 [Verrucomicrobiae bacterium]
MPLVDPVHKKTARRTLSRKLFYFLLVFFLAALILLLFHTGRTRRFRFSDGAVVQLVAVLRANDRTYDPFLYRLGRRHLPKTLSKIVPPAVKLRPQEALTNSIFVYYYDPKWKLKDSRIIPIDDLGHPFIDASSLGSQLPHDYFLFRLHHFPRRQRDFLVAFVNSYETNHIRVPNPYFAQFPNWQPEPLPIARTNGPAVLSLTNYSLKTGENGAPAFLDTRFHFHSSDPQWAKASPGRRTLQDATGNSTHHLLSFAEPVWRIAQEYQRRDFDSFQPHEKLRWSGLTFPSSNTVPLSGIITTNQRQVIILALAGFGSFQITNGIWPGAPSKYVLQHLHSASSSSTDFKVSCDASPSGTNIIATWTVSQPALFLATTGLPDLNELLVRLTQSGPELDHLFGAEFDTGPNEVLRIIPLPVDQSRNFDLELALSTPIAFHFYIAAPKHLPFLRDSRSISAE